jgi:ring-1,2-phenylacetyl-CoA epoxidase subunit PaaE
MALHFHSLQICSIEHETVDSVTIGFHIPDNLKALYKYIQGQNITLKTTIEGKEVRRSYSICKAPYENEICIAIKKIPGGLFSNYALQQLKVNDWLDVLPPTGKFNTPLDALQQKNYVAFAAGSGITPIFSIIKQTLKVEPKSTFTLVYGNKTKNSTLFFEALEGIKNTYLQRFNLIHVLSKEVTDTDIHSGRIDAHKLVQLQRLIDYKSVHEFFLCGPESMIFTIRDFLLEHGVPLNHIHFELFGTPYMQAKKATEIDATASLLPKSSITIKLDGRMFSFELANNEQNILDAALENGADLPFACKGGVCCTCKAKLTEGEVSMDVNYALEADEVANGFILTCQSHPKSKSVVIDFDQR